MCQKGENVSKKIREVVENNEYAQLEVTWHIQRTVNTFRYLSYRMDVFFRINIPRVLERFTAISTSARNRKSAMFDCRLVGFSRHV